MKKLLTPQVRTFAYGAVAALLSVATVKGWVGTDVAASIQENLPTIMGSIASIIAAANVTEKPVVVAEVAKVVEPEAPQPSPDVIAHTMTAPQ